MPSSSRHGLGRCSHIDFNPAIDSDVCIHIFKERKKGPCVVSDWTFFLVSWRLAQALRWTKWRYSLQKLCVAVLRLYWYNSLLCVFHVLQSLLFFKYCFDLQNVALLCLLFSHIVSVIGTHNISLLALLATVGIIYGVTGTLMAWIIRSFFWVPHRFRYGILATGCWGSLGDMHMCTLPLADRPIWVNFFWNLAAAIALGITASAPFNGVDDQNLVVAYISMFIFVFFVCSLLGVQYMKPTDVLKITLFALRGYLIVAKDFKGPDLSLEELWEWMYLRQHRMATNAALLLGRLLCLSWNPTSAKKNKVK